MWLALCNKVICYKLTKQNKILEEYANFKINFSIYLYEIATDSKVTILNLRILLMAVIFYYKFMHLECNCKDCVHTIEFKVYPDGIKIQKILYMLFHQTVQL